MRFWDSSAIVPLIVTEKESDIRCQACLTDPDILVWYGTLAEIESAIQRRRREGVLVSEQENLARVKLKALSQQWHEVQPTPEVRDRALRLLRTHPLRAADAFQLAAALVVCSERTSGFYFYSGDQRLRTAAAAEGFEVA